MGGGGGCSCVRACLCLCVCVCVALKSVSTLFCMSACLEKMSIIVSVGDGGWVVRGGGGVFVGTCVIVFKGCVVLYSNILISLTRPQLKYPYLLVYLGNKISIIVSVGDGGCGGWEVGGCSWVHVCVCDGLSKKEVGGIRGTVLAHWTAGQQVERSILHQGMICNKIHLISPGCSRPSIALQVKNCGLKHQSFHFI